MVTVAAVNVYAAAETVLSLHISVSNLIVLWIYITSQHLRTVTNTYVFSLALTDFLIGTIAIPLTVYTVVTRAPHSFLPCLTIHSLLCVLCTISTFHLLAIAVDKYISICSKGQILIKASGRERATVLIANAWIFGVLVSVVPLLWFTDFYRSNKLYSGECYFNEVVDYRYLVYVIFFGTIIVPTFIIIYCYTSIYSRIREEEQQIKCFLRGRERERRIRGRRKLVSVLLLLVATYGICWYPLYIINTINLFFPKLHSNGNVTLSAVVLSHVSSAINPLIYAYGIPGFKQALQTIIRHSANDFGFHRFSGKSVFSNIFLDQINSPRCCTVLSPRYSYAFSPRFSTTSNSYYYQRSKLPRKTSEPVPVKTLKQAVQKNCDRFVHIPVDMHERDETKFFKSLEK